MKNTICLVVVLVAMVLTMVACQEGDIDNSSSSNFTCCPDNNCVPDTDALQVSLSPDSPSGEIPPGYRVLAVFTVKAQEDSEIYGLDLEVPSNYDHPWLWLVDAVWIENQDGKMVYEPQTVNNSGFQFWGMHQVPAGESQLVVVGHITDGEQFDSEWDPRPEIQVMVTSIYTDKEVEPDGVLYGNVLTPKYPGTTRIQTQVAADSPTGTFFEGYVYTLLMFEMWADQGDFYFSNAVFEISDFDGELQGCSFWQGNTLLSDQVTKHYLNNPYIMFDENSISQQTLITTEHVSFSLVCQVQTNSDHQLVQARLAGGRYPIGPSGNFVYINGGEWGPILEFVKQETFQFTLHPDSITPKELVPGANQTLMKFYMNTSAGLAEVYTLEFTFRNWFSGDYSNCRLQDSQGTVINSSASAGFDPNGGDDLYMTFFFGPQDGIYPGYGNTYKVGTNSQEIYVVCDVGYQPGHAMAIDLNYASLYTESVYNYTVLPDGYIKLTSTVYQ